MNDIIEQQQEVEKNQEYHNPRFSQYHLDKTITQTHQATIDEVVRIAENAPAQDVDEYVKIIKAGLWDKMFDLGRQSVIHSLKAQVAEDKKE
jgi:hypothetical protein